MLPILNGDWLGGFSSIHFLLFNKWMNRLAMLTIYKTAFDFSGTINHNAFRKSKTNPWIDRSGKKSEKIKLLPLPYFFHLLGFCLACDLWCVCLFTFSIASWHEFNWMCRQLPVSLLFLLDQHYSLFPHCILLSLMLIIIFPIGLMAQQIQLTIDYYYYYYYF